MKINTIITFVLSVAITSNMLFAAEPLHSLPIQNAHRIRPAQAKMVGTNLIKIGIITASCGLIFVGYGIFDINRTPSEVFPIIGFGSGIVGVSLITISIPMASAGMIVRCKAKHRMNKRQQI